MKNKFETRVSSEDNLFPVRLSGRLSSLVPLKQAGARGKAGALLARLSLVDPSLSFLNQQKTPTAAYLLTHLPNQHLLIP